MVRTHHSSGRPSLLKALLMKLGVISQQQQSSLSPSLPRSSSTVTLHINLQSVSGENNNQVNNDLDNEDGFQYDGVVIHITNQTPEEALRHDNDEERIPTPARQNPRSRVLKISKPPGEPGRPGCGGYSLDSVLRNELSWSKEDVVRFMKSVRKESQRSATRGSYRNQSETRIKAICEKDDGQRSLPTTAGL